MNGTGRSFGSLRPNNPGDGGSGCDGNGSADDCEPGSTATPADDAASQFYSSAPSVGSKATTPLLSGNQPALEHQRHSSSSFSAPHRPPTLRTLGPMHRRLSSQSSSRTRIHRSIPLLDRLCCNYKRSHMTLRERLTLSAFKKWRYHGRFPFKLLLHVLLLIFSTGQILVWNFEDGGYYRSINRNWQYWFLHYSSATSSCDLFTYDEVIESLNSTISNYYNIDSLSVDSFKTHSQRGNSSIDHGGDDDSSALPVFVYEYYKYPDSIFDYDVTNPNLATATRQYYLNESYSGPFDVASLGKETVVANINKLNKATLTLRLDSFLFGTVYRSCLEWVVDVVWDFRDRGQIKQSVSSNVQGACTNIAWSEAILYEWLWLNIPVVIFAVCYCVLSFKAVVSQFRIFLAIRRRQRLIEKRNLDSQSPRTQLKSHRWHGAPVTWGSLSCRDKFQFFTVYLVLNLVACICLISVGITNLTQLKSHSPTNYWPKLLAGPGCALMWFTLLQYFEQNSSYSILVVTLKRGVPRVGRFMVGVMPMMLGYALFGMVCFGSYSDRFSSFSAAMITLFAVLNGDVIRETFLDLETQSATISQIYMYTFICLFIYVVLNVFIAIIEEAFFSAWEAGKRKHRTSDKAPLTDTRSSPAAAISSGKSEQSHEGNDDEDNLDRRRSIAQRFSHSQYSEGALPSADGKGEGDSAVAAAALEDAEAYFDGGDESKYKKSKPRPVSRRSLPGHWPTVAGGRNALRRVRTIDDEAALHRAPTELDEILVSGNSWNRFRELLHNIETDELKQRHQELHGLDKMVHDEVQRRRQGESLQGAVNGVDAGGKSGAAAGDV